MKRSTVRAIFVQFIVEIMSTQTRMSRKKNLAIFPSEIPVSALVVHLLVHDVLAVGCASLQVPRALRFIRAVVGDEWSCAPVEILLRGRQGWSAVRLVGTTNDVCDDFLGARVAVAVHFRGFEVVALEKIGRKCLKSRNRC
jgi:hypothetical protein